MATYPMKFLKDKNGNGVLPITALKAVRDENNTPLDEIIENLEIEAGSIQPDNEDLQLVDSKLKFKDRPNTDGMGRIILRKNMVSDVNTLTQSMINQANTIYVIQYDFTLGEDITVPTGCILEFEGGSVSAGSGENMNIITGTNTVIKAELVKIFNADVTLAGTWNVAEAYPEWFGAKGDGITDDTAAIQAALKLDGTDRLMFGNKTYIVNVKQGTDATTTPRNIFENIKVYNIVGTGNSKIRLGNNNNGDVQSFKGYGAIFYCGGHKDFIFDGIIFDFNYTNNPIYQTAVSVGVESNGQQCAVLAYLAASLIVRNCTFIEPSGTNTITYIASDTAEHLGFICENNNFIDVGKKSYHRDGGQVLDAYHDVSTIGCHFRGTGVRNAKLTAIIRNNTARGAGGNAFDFCECHADSMIFENNTVINYKYCVMPLAGVVDNTVTICNNKFIGCVKGVNIWNADEDAFTAPKGSYGYKEINIFNNYAELDFMYWYNTPCYGNVTKDGNGYYNPNNNSFGFVTFNGQGNKNIHKIKVSENHIEYRENIKNVPASYIKINGFGVINAYYIPYYADVDNIIDVLEITNNIIIDAPNLIWSNNGFNYIKNFIFSDNTIFGLYSNPNINNRQEGFLRDIVTNVGDLVRKVNKAVIINNSVECYPNDNFIFIECFGLIRNTELIEKSVAYVKGNSFFGERYSSLMTINNMEYVDRDGNKTNRTARPTTLGVNDVGYQYFDATLGKPIYWNGTAWIDATGTPV